MNLQTSLDDPLTSPLNTFDSFENYPFCKAILCISSPDLINSILNLLQEKKVILICNRVSEAALLIKTMITLLKPFRWPSGILTVLTADLIDYLDAPFPFLAGVDRDTWQTILARRGSSLDDELTYIDVESGSGETGGLNYTHSLLNEDGYMDYTTEEEILSL